MTSNPDFAERGLGQEPQALGTFRVARVDNEGDEEERKKSYTATRTECYTPPPNPPKFSRGHGNCMQKCSHHIVSMKYGLLYRKVESRGIGLDIYRVGIHGLQ